MLNQEALKDLSAAAGTYQRAAACAQRVWGKESAKYLVMLRAGTHTGLVSSHTGLVSSMEGLLSSLRSQRMPREISSAAPS